jgi:prepilin-type N-terminal cleavage/methylation domain-containing protein
MRRADGFSLIEMLVAMTIMLGVTAAVFSVMNPSTGTFKAQPEVSDMQQRLRIGADSLYRELVMAGAGAYQGTMSGSFAYMFAPILPFRKGSTNDDPPGTFRSDTITLMYVPETFGQTTLAGKGPSLKSAEIGVNPDPGCPADNPLSCGFQDGMTVMIYDDSGNYDTFTITNVQDSSLHLQHNSDTLSYIDYNETTKIVQVANSVYYLKSDDTTQTYQLMRYDGGLGPDVPIVDNVVGLKFEYYGDPEPPQLIKPLTANPPVTTYGPKPPALGVQSSAYPAGENCAFKVDPGTGLQVPRLADLSAGNPNALVPLTAAQLTDGPWCPDAASPIRWDADLLRIRKVAVTLRVQAAVASLRGPASALFTHAGTSNGGNTWVPDQEIRFEVSPRNMNLGR